MENKRKFKITLICMSVVVCCFLLAGIIQTFILKSFQNDLKTTQANTAQLEQDYKDKKSKSDYMSNNPDDMESDDYSDQYYEDYWKSQGYGEDGDKNIGTGE